MFFEETTQGLTLKFLAVTFSLFVSYHLKENMCWIFIPYNQICGLKKFFSKLYWPLLRGSINLLLLLMPQTSLCNRELLLDFYRTSNRKPTQIIVFRYRYTLCWAIDFLFERYSKNSHYLMLVSKVWLGGRSRYGPWPSALLILVSKSSRILKISCICLFDSKIIC